MDWAAPPWPAWKFGLNQDDLYTTLHDQYNTFPSAIQDHEAFYHDVLDVATNTATLDQFHARLQERRNTRLQELHQALDSTACELVGRPSLLPGDTDHWANALRIFRSKSLDALVQYFSMFLPLEERGLESYQPQPPPTPAQSPNPLIVNPYKRFNLSAVLDEQRRQRHSPPTNNAPSPPPASTIDRPPAQQPRRRRARLDKHISEPRRSQRILQTKGVTHHNIRKPEPRRKMAKIQRAKG